VKKNGEIIWINLTRSVIRDQAGEPLYGLCMVEDITEVKRTQEEALPGRSWKAWECWQGASPMTSTICWAAY
jgi:hypothetical protein